MSTSADKISRARAHQAGTNGVTSGRRRRYERTTPVGRARKNLTKIDRTLQLVRVRLESWGAETDEGPLNRALASVLGAIREISEAAGHITSLEKSHWTPPRRSSVLVFEEGDEVRILDKYQGKYLEVYPAEAIARLVVGKVLPSGEIAVRHGKSSTFIVPKSHLGRRESKKGA